jgi:deoxyadenosine/deoxycytidine kinase
MKTNYTIALAGAPAAGKSSVLKMLNRMPRNEKFKVIFLDETATVFLHNRSDAISALDSPLLRQHYILRSQMRSENILLENASDAERPTLLITDRGAVDAMVYLFDEDFHKLGVDADKLFSRYDLVIFLEGKEDNFAHMILLLRESKRIMTKSKR